jgi:hypothetical protein
MMDGIDNKTVLVIGPDPLSAVATDADNEFSHGLDSLLVPRLCLGTCVLSFPKQSLGYEGGAPARIFRPTTYFILQLFSKSRQDEGIRKNPTVTQIG